MLQPLLSNGDSRNKCVNTRLHDWIIHQRRVEFIKVFQSFKSNKNARGNANTPNSKDKTTARHIACGHGGQSISTKVFLRINDKVNARDYWADTPLHEMMVLADVETVQKLLDLVVPVDVENDKNKCPLIEAIRKRNVGDVQQLIKGGSTVNPENARNGWSPLHLAAIFNKNDSYFDVIDALLKNGARIDAKDNDEKTPLYHLAGQADVRTVQLLLDYKPRIDIKSNEGETPLTEAIRHGNVGVVKLLIKHGSKVNARNAVYKRWPIHVAAIQNRNDSHFSVIEALLKSGARIDVKDIKGRTPLHHLARHADIKTVRLLLNRDSNVNVKDYNGQTPLTFAVRQENVELVRLLVDHGSKVDVADYGRTTPLHVACRHNNELKIVKFLMKNGANVDAIDGEKCTPLMSAMQNPYRVNRKKKMIFLLNYVDVNKMNYQKFRDLLKGKCEKIFFEHLAKLLASDLSVDSNIVVRMTRSQDRFRCDHFDKCTNDLLLAKRRKLRNCWVSFYNLLADDKKKLKNHAGNKELVSDFRKNKTNKKVSNLRSSDAKKTRRKASRDEDF